MRLPRYSGPESGREAAAGEGRGRRTVLGEAVAGEGERDSMIA
jgi:hypothetical protein